MMLLLAGSLSTREIEAFYGARIMANRSHIYTKLVSDAHIHYLFGCYKEEYLIDFPCELVALEDDSEGNQSPDQSELPGTSKKKNEAGKVVMEPVPKRKKPGSRKVHPKCQSCPHLHLHHLQLKQNSSPQVQ